MADENGAAQSASVWPMPKFHFKVMWNDVQMSFQEVSGLDAQSEEIKYRSGDSPIFSPVKMPGLVKYSNVNTIERTTVTISLLDEGGAETMVWTLKNAWPTKVTGTDLKSEGNEVAIETIEIVHEGLEIKNG